MEYIISRRDKKYAMSKDSLSITFELRIKNTKNVSKNNSSCSRFTIIYKQIHMLHIWVGDISPSKGPWSAARRSAKIQPDKLTSSFLSK